MAYGKEVQAMAWSIYGPYGSEPIQMGFINTSLVPLENDPTFQLIAPKMVGPSIVAWNPYEMKYYVAGLGNHMPDWYPNIGSSNPPNVYDPTEPDQDATIYGPLLRPSGIDETAWISALELGSSGYIGTANNENVSRLMLLSADCSTGIEDANGNAVPYNQVYGIAGKTASNTETFKLISQEFTTITAFEFSPNITAVGGSLTSQAGVQTAIVMYRTGVSPGASDMKAKWSKLELGPGFVTSMKYAGYAWYIATWNPIATQNPQTLLFEGASSMYFLSINFNVATLLDAFDANTNTAYKIVSMDSSVSQTGICGPDYEPNPENPNLCVKKCPTGFTAFGTLCVQTCPAPYLETGLPNECVPDSVAAKLVTPTANGGSPTTVAPVLQPGASKLGGTQQPVTSLNWVNVMVISILSAILGLLFIGIFLHRRK
jgi:hypothetical protein